MNIISWFKQLFTKPLPTPPPDTLFCSFYDEGERLILQKEMRRNDASRASKYGSEPSQYAQTLWSASHEHGYNDPEFLSKSPDTENTAPAVFDRKPAP